MLKPPRDNWLAVLFSTHYVPFNQTEILYWPLFNHQEIHCELLCQESSTSFFPAHYDYQYCKNQQPSLVWFTIPNPCWPMCVLLKGSWLIFKTTIHNHQAVYSQPTISRYSNCPSSNHSSIASKTMMVINKSIIHQSLTNIHHPSRTLSTPLTITLTIA